MTVLVRIVTAYHSGIDPMKTICQSPKRRQMTVIVNKDVLTNFYNVCKFKKVSAAAEIRDRIYFFNDVNADAEANPKKDRVIRKMEFVGDQARFVINLDAYEHAIFKELVENDERTVSSVIRGWIEQFTEKNKIKQAVINA